jgi:hypothetical protein
LTGDRMRRIEAIISPLGVWLLCSFAHGALSAGDATTAPFNHRGAPALSINIQNLLTGPDVSRGRHQ